MRVENTVKLLRRTITISGSDLRREIFKQAGIDEGAAKYPYSFKATYLDRDEDGDMWFDLNSLLDVRFVITEEREAGPSDTTEEPQ